MKTVTENDQSLKDYWEKQITACKKSGARKSNYCRENHLSYSQMIYWQRKLAMDKQPALVPVKIKNDPMRQNDNCICSLTLVGGHVLKIHDEKAFSLLLEKWR